MRCRPLSIAAICAALVLSSCGGDDDTVSPPSDDDASTSAPSGEPAAVATPVAHDAWVRMPAMGQTVAAGYVTFVNSADVDVQVVGVSSRLATAELHETIAADDGVMRMQERPDGFVVPAGGELVLAPGGAHVMFLGIDPLDMATRDDVELTFDFGDVGEVVVVAEIRRDASVPDHDDVHDTVHDVEEHDTVHDDVHDDDGDAGGDAAGEEPVLDVAALHELDDELNTGVFEPERQRALVVESLAALEAMLAGDPAELPDDVNIDRLVAALEELDAALESSDVELAGELSFEVHDLTHALVPGDHHSH